MRSACHERAIPTAKDPTRRTHPGGCGYRGGRERIVPCNQTNPPFVGCIFVEVSEHDMVVEEMAKWSGGFVLLNEPTGRCCSVGSVEFWCQLASLSPLSYDCDLSTAWSRLVELGFRASRHYTTPSWRSPSASAPENEATGRCYVVGEAATTLRSNSVQATHGPPNGGGH